VLLIGVFNMFSQEGLLCNAILVLFLYPGVYGSPLTHIQHKTKMHRFVFFTFFLWPQSTFHSKMI